VDKKKEMGDEDEKDMEDMREPEKSGLRFA
jgi:hypothetical protein